MLVQPVINTSKDVAMQGVKALASTRLGRQVLTKRLEVVEFSFMGGSPVGVTF